MDVREKASSASPSRALAILRMSSLDTDTKHLHLPRLVARNKWDYIDAKNLVQYAIEVIDQCIRQLYSKFA